MTKKNSAPPAAKDKEPSISLGNYLQRERQKKKLSLQEIAKATKVPYEALQALETGDKKKLPVPVFAKGFVKIYSGYLGLNENDILKRFQKEWAVDPTAATPEMLHEESMAQISPFYLSGQFYFIIIAVVLFLGLAYFFFNADTQTNQDLSLKTIREIQPLSVARVQQDQPVTISKITIADKQVNLPLISPTSAGKISREEDEHDDLILASLPSVTIVKPPPTPKPVKRAAPQPVVVQKQISTLETKPEDDPEYELLPEDLGEISPSLVLPLDLHISFLAKTRISISQDDSSPARYIFSSGEESSWSADKTISMQVEKAENVRITLNGKAVPLPKTKDRPLAITLPADLYSH